MNLSRKTANEERSQLVIDVTEVELRIKDIIIGDALNKKPIDNTKKSVIAEIKKISTKVENKRLKGQIVYGLALAFAKWTKIVNSGLSNVSQKTIVPTVKAREPPKNGEFKGIYFNIPNRPYITSSDNGVAIVEDHSKKLRQEYTHIINDIAKRNALIDKNVSIRNIAEIEVRWNRNQETIEELKSRNVELVFATSHANCSTRCEPWQGKMYSLNGTYGSRNGKLYIPIEVAMNGEKNDHNGILGYNCRHRLVEYKTGMKPPKEFTERQINQAREVDKKQRYMERRIRHLKEMAYLFRKEDYKLTEKLWAKAREKTAKYREYSEKQNRPAYIYRTEVMHEEEAFLMRQKV